MRWEGRRQSENVEDQRRGGRVMMAGGGLGLGTVVLLLLYMVLGGDPGDVIQQLPQGGGPVAGGPGGDEGVPEDGAPDPDREFVGVVLADTEDVWTELFRESLGAEYQKPKLTLFRGQVESACGIAGAAVGPFYCPVDRKVYLDTQFFREMQEKLNAPGDFARAYVIAHEVGHHVQNQLGLTDKIQEAQRQASKLEGNQLSVRLELQADYLAGVWAHHANKAKSILESGDIEEGLNCASSIGDDRLQKQAQGRVRPDAFTHGSSAQRVRWFKEGLKTGDFSKESINRFFKSDDL